VLSPPNAKQAFSRCGSTRTNLPFAKGFFDAVIAIDSFLYYGTDDRYLGYLVQFLKAGGYIGVVESPSPVMFARLTTPPNIFALNSRNIGAMCAPSPGGHSTGRKPDWSTSNVPSFYQKATSFCKIT
jgi:hypothetical protein